MRAPEVLLLDDGELDDVGNLLEGLQVRFQRLRGGELRRDIPNPRRLLITTPRRVASLAENQRADVAPLRIVVSEGDSEGMRAQLRSTGFDYLVRRPVHPEALRLLLLRCLYAGEEHREDPRLPVGSQVSFRSGLRPRTATLIDLSAGGCRLLSEGRIPVGKRLHVQLPADEARKAHRAVPGRVVRVDEDATSPSSGRWRLGIAFETLSDTARADLERALASYTHGPARLPRPVPSADTPQSQQTGEHHELLEVKLSPGPEEMAGESPPQRECNPDIEDQRQSARVKFDQEVPAFGKSALRVLMGRDLSTRGMRIEPHSGLELGDRVHLAIYGDPEESPAMVWATIRRDDGEGGLVALFDPVGADVAVELERWVARLPIIEPLQAGERQSLGAVLSEILTG